MSQLSSQQLKVFVPARDYAVSQRFYRALGFVQEDEVGNVTCFRHGAQCAFLLQDFYVRELAENLMLHLWVDDADAWWQHVHDIGLDAQFGASVSAPEDRPWGARDFTLHDPSGVLWRSGSRCEAGIGGFVMRDWLTPVVHQLLPIPTHESRIPALKRLR